MYVIKNALLNTKRNFGRNFIVGLVIFIICLSTVVSFAINNSSNSIVDSAKDKYQGEVTIDLNHEKLMSSTERVSIDQIEKIDQADYLKYAKSEYVEATAFEYTSYAYSDEVTEYTETSENDEAAPMGGGMQIRTSGDDIYTTQPTFNVIGNNDYNNMSDFISEEKVLVEGEMFTTEDEVIISSDLAALNEYSVGDTINIYSSIDDSMITYTITGLYDIYSDDSDAVPFARDAFMLEQNNIYTTLEGSSLLTNSEYTGGRLTATYFLTSSKDFDNFVSDVDSMGLNENYKVTYDEMSYNAVVNPITSLTTFITVFMIVVFAVGGIILLLTTMLILRERKYEVGVLRSIGMSKFKLIVQFMLENIIIAVVALLIALPVGVAISEPVANNLLSSQNDSQTTITNNTMPGGRVAMNAPPGGMMNSSNYATIESIDVSLTTVTLLEIISVTVILIVLSSLFSLIYITKFEPISILSDN